MLSCIFFIVMKSLPSFSDTHDFAKLVKTHHQMHAQKKHRSYVVYWLVLTKDDHSRRQN